jgi:GNAT superfamily N-acetyltransferase
MSGNDRRRGATRVRIREITTASDPALRPAYRILRSAFHKAELTPLTEWTQTLRERSQRLWTDVAWHLLVAERGSTAVGAASGTYLGNLNVGVVGYLAVTPGARSLGLGPRLRRRLAELFARDARRILHRPLRAIVGEVREDNPWLRTLVNRRGAIALDFPYMQPALGRTGKAVPLVLYYQPVAEPPRRSLSGPEIRRLLYSVFRRAYRIPRPLERAAFRRMLAALAGRRRIGQRRLPRVTAPSP